MKNILLLIVLCLAVACCNARTVQGEKAKTEIAYPGTDSSSFDFWIGNWALTWNDTSHGSNLIQKEMDSKVIHENFTDPTGGYTGQSWSVYKPSKKLWQQTWVDNTGVYLTFKGGAQGNTRVFEGEQQLKSGGREMYRMVFYNITANGFDWEWKKSTDDGATWEVMWKIAYKRKI